MAMVQDNLIRQLGVAYDPGYADGFELADAQTELYAGGMACLNVSTGLVVEASDASGLMVLGCVQMDASDPTDTDTKVAVIRPGIYQYAQSGTTIDRKDIGKPVMVVDALTVTRDATSHNVCAGIVRDVDVDGVWVEQTVLAIASSGYRVGV